MSSKLEKLRQEIYEEQDKILFDEAIKCYKTKAYRMAYIAIWIAIAESLKNKFKIMAEKDDTVDNIVKEIENLENNHKSVDKFILEKAKEIGVIDDVAYLQIEPILNMRNIYGHPYSISPNSDEVYVVTKLAVERVLSIPPLLRKPYINNLLDNLQKNRHYIDDVEDKVVKFAVDVSGKILPNLYPYFLKCLFYRLDEVINDPDKQIFSNRLIYFTQAFIKQIKPDFSDSEWNFLKDKFDNFPKAVSEILCDIDIWKLISEGVQDCILSYLLFPEKESEVKLPKAQELKRTFSIFINKNLSLRQEERFKEVFSKIGIETKAKAEIPLSYYVEDIINSLSSHNWYKQNPAASVLWNLGPMKMKDISCAILKQLGRNILQSADGNAKDSIDFIKKSLELKIKWPNSFIEGLLYECFLNEKNMFRCKYKFIKEVILATIRCNEGNSIALINKLLDDIDTCKPKSNFIEFLDIDKALPEIIEANSSLCIDEKNMFGVGIDILIEKLKKFEKDLQKKIIKSWSKNDTSEIQRI